MACCLSRRSSFLKKKLAGSLGLVLLTLGMMGCKESGTAAAGPPPAVEVTYVTVTPRTLPVSYEFIGQTEASQMVEIRARVQGFLLNWRQNKQGKPNFIEGGPVVKDQVLFEIDPKQFQVALEEANASLARAEARLQQANRDVVRLTEAVAKNAAAGRELDDAVTEQLQAAADVRLQKSIIASRDLDLGYTTIQSPLDGVIGQAQKDVGSLVDENQNSLLATVLKLDPIYAYFSFSERDYVNFRQDVTSGRVLLGPTGTLHVEISLIDGTEYPYAGEITFSDVQIDPRTGTARLRATFHNPPINTPSGPDHFLKPGQFVKGRIVGWERPNTILVPQQSVVQGATGAFVYVIGADNEAVVRPVTTGNWQGADWIINSGLNAGDRVIVSGAAKMAPNVTVKPVAEEPPAKPNTRPAKPTSGPATGPMTQQALPPYLPATAPSAPPAGEPGAGSEHRQSRPTTPTPASDSPANPGANTR